MGLFGNERNMWKETFSGLHLMEADLRVIVKWQQIYERLQGETQGKNKVVMVLRLWQIAINILH